MKSYTALRNLYGKLTLDTSAANLTFGDGLVNDEHRHLLSLADFSFAHRARTVATAASTTFVALPYDISQVETVTVTVSSTVYTPKLIHSRERWNMLNEITQNSDIPEYATEYNGQIGLWPRPITAGNTITVSGKILARDLAVADNISQTITTLANGSTSITLNGGLTDQHVGFWIRPTLSATDNTGDGRWYEIAGYTSATVATLSRAYGGNSIAAGTAACTIGQMPLLPEEFHEIPAYAAAETYWSTTGRNMERASFFGAKRKELTISLLENYKSGVTDPVLHGGAGDRVSNPNLFITT